VTRNVFFIIILSLVVFSNSAQAQTTGEVRGFVYDKETGEPLIFTTIFLKEIMVGNQTDINGFFSLTKIKPGTYTLTCVALGYDTASAKVTIKAGEIINQKLFASKVVQKLNEVQISAERQKQKTEVKISAHTITQKELKALPAFGGEPDLAQYLQVLPGVVFSGDQGGQLYIRGGTPVHNKVLLDGMIIYNPFHSIGLFSVFDADIIRSADVSAGGFGAQYGGRIGAIVDVNTREGNKTRLGGKVSMSPISAKVLLEGPFSKFKEDGSSSSFILSAKTSYLNKTAPSLYTHAGNNGLPFSFLDLYGKASFIGANGTKLNAFAFNFDDKVNYPETQYNWVSRGMGSNFVIVPEGSTIINGNVAYSQYKMVQNEADNRPRESSINGFNIGLNFSHFIGKDDLKYGVEMNGFSTDFNYTNSNGRNLQQQDYTTELAAFLKYRKNFGRLIVEPGLRTQLYASLGEATLEPRLGAKYNVNSWLRLKGATGYYTQNLMAAVSDQDVVNLFYGFLSSPEELQGTYNGEAVKSSLQKAWHYGIGFEIDIARHHEINIEGFYKKFTQLTNINRDKIYNTDDRYDPSTGAARPPSQYLDFIVERGSSYGMDFKYKYENKQFYIWAVYSLTFVDRFAERVDANGNTYEDTYFPHFDRRHNLNIVTTYTFDKAKSWNLNVRWNYGSGFPFTQTQGFYERLNTQPGTNPLTQNGTIGVKYAELNNGRLPAFHRLDASLSKKMNFNKNTSLTITAGATNVYNRENIFYFDRSRFTRINQLPIIPTVGINLSF
jgi:hypothetical protein